MAKTYHIDNKLEDQLQRLDKKFDGDKESDHEAMSKTLDKVLDDHEFYATEYPALMTERNNLKDEEARLQKEVAEFRKANEILKEQVEEWEAQNNTSGYDLVNSFSLGKWFIEIKSKK